LCQCPDLAEDERAAWLRRAERREQPFDADLVRTVWTEYADGAYAGWGSSRQVARAVIDVLRADKENARYSHLAVAELDARAAAAQVRAPAMLVFNPSGPFAKRQAGLAGAFPQPAVVREFPATSPLYFQREPAAFAEVIRAFAS
jgi:hypothetical protein